MKKWFKRIGILLLCFFVLLNIMAASYAYRFSHFYPPEEIKDVAFGKLNFSAKAGYLLLGTKFPKSVITDKPENHFTDITITTEDNIKLAGWYLQHGIHDSIKPMGTVLAFHGISASRSALADEIDAFYAMGYNVCTVDFRGHGQSEGYTCTLGHKEVNDIKAVYDFISAKGEKNIILYGRSMGAATILRTTAEKNIHPSGIIMDAAFGSVPEGVRGRVRMMKKIPVEPFATLMCFWGGLEEGYWSFGIKTWESAQKVSCPVLVERGTVDVRVSEEETQHIYNNLTSPQKKLVEYEGCEHESFLDKLPEKWKGGVSDFLKGK